MPISTLTTANRDSWNAIAPARTPQPARYFLDGGSTLEEWEASALGHVDGARMLHLQCASGNETFSWAMRGARVVGVDISDVAIAQARATAADLPGAAVDFVAADVYDLPDGLGRFDIVYASAGVVCWLPDLDRWARIVASHLEPGGTFLLNEHHPVWEVLAVHAAVGDQPATVEPTLDYFGRVPLREGYDDTKRPRGWTSQVEFTSFVWPVGDVVTALLRAGLRLVEFTELPVPDMYTGLGIRAGWLPAAYQVRAIRPAAAEECMAGAGGGQ
jgi:SAM-dependent methyltransferase